MAIQAIQYPGHVFEWRGIQFFMRDTHIGAALIIRLLSGRELTYHQAKVSPSPRWPGQLAITYMTWNSNPKYGPMGWVPMETYGGRLTENIVQATAHDVLRFAILNLRAAGYPTVLHVYDEIVAEVPAGTGSIEEMERIMATMPPWAHDAAGVPWPIHAAGGWRGIRYRKG
jgi:DNA polymerase